MENTLAPETGLETAVKIRNWLAVEHILELQEYSSGALDQFIRACEKHDKIHLNKSILSHCTTQQLDRLLTLATTKKEWKDVHRLLAAGGSDEKHLWVIQQACETADDSHFGYYILPHCSDDQLESVLKNLMTRNLWKSVGKVIERFVSNTQHKRAVEEASKTASDRNFVCYILPHCSDDQLETVLICLVMRGLWESVGKVLETGVTISDSQRMWAIAKASKTANDQDFESYILPHCSDDQLESLLTQLVTRGLWWSVGKVLERGVSDTQHRWAVEEASKTANGSRIRYILPHCTDDQLESVLTHLVTRGLWESVGKVLERGVRDTQHRWAVEEASKTDSDRNFVYYILPHCSDDQLGSVLTHLVTRGLWESVGDVLERGVSDTQRKWAVEEASKTASYQNFEIYILPHCSDDQLESVLTHLVTGRLWQSVGEVLERGVSVTQNRWAVEEASKTANDWQLSDYILPHCSDDQLESVLTNLVTRGLWMSVGKVLERGVSVTQHKWSIEEASKTANDTNFVYFILLHCRDDQLESVLTHLVTRRLWMSVGKVLKRGVSDTQQRWAVQEASKTADDFDFKHCILHHCRDDQLESLLKRLMTRGLWESVDKVLERGVSDTQHRWAVEEASKTAANDWRISYILHHCRDDQLGSVLTHLVTRGLWESVGKVLKRGVSDKQHRWAVEEASKTANDLVFERYILPHCSDDQLESVLTQLVTRRLWMSVGKVLERGVSDPQHRWAVEEASETAGDKDFERYILRHCSDDQLESVLIHLVPNYRWESVCKVLERGVSDTQHRWAVKQASILANDWPLSYLLPHCSDDQLESVLKHLMTRGLWVSIGKVLERGVSAKSSTRALSQICTDVTFEYSYTKVMESIPFYLGKANVNLLINSLQSNKLSREAQILALRFALQQRRWDVISRASLSQMWEQVRRHLFREAVYQERWTIVKKWADHTLYDDERWWALEETYKHKQWDVMLQLADHGLTEIELMRVRYRLAKHADWEVVLRMIGRGVDVTEVREVLESTVISRKTKTTTDTATQIALAFRWSQLRQLEETLTRASARRLKLPSTALQWRTVMYRLHRHPGTVSVPSRSQPGKTFGGLLLQRAIEKRLWHVVMHLVTLGLNTDQLDSLLTDMMRRRQWGVCRVLLEQGVSVQSCLSALSVFMEMNQWTLVARVMEFIVDDPLKRQVEQLALNRSVGSLVWQCVSAMFRYGMRVGDVVRVTVMLRAMKRREGSVVGECINTLQHFRLASLDREELFQKAVSNGFLQALKPLVEEKKETETQRRDVVMLAAIEQRQWDVVDCCQLQGADINMKDERGETPLNREVRKEDMKTVEWKAVEELLMRGADPNVLDKDGGSVLNRAIEAKQWDIVRLLIECLGDIHKAAKSNDFYQTERKTPLQLLIDKHQGEIIDHTLIWCPDQAKGVNEKGETTLHVIALDKRPELLYYQIVRGVNPLKLTNEGHSVLFYAVQNGHCPQRMVGECIRLGFSTHQPLPYQVTTRDISKYVATKFLICCIKRKHYGMLTYVRTSPFLLAVVRGMHVVAHMLYESGSCSYSELLHLYTVLLDLSDPHTVEGRELLEGAHLDYWDRHYYSERYRQHHETFMNTLSAFMPYLKDMASTPRSLVSTCRLAISHCLTVRRRHVRAVQDLDLTDRMKDYLLFSDLTDPDYQPSLYSSANDTELKQRKELVEWMKKTLNKIQKQLELEDIKT